MGCCLLYRSLLQTQYSSHVVGPQWTAVGFLMLLLSLHYGSGVVEPG